MSLLASAFLFFFSADQTLAFSSAVAALDIVASRFAAYRVFCFVHLVAGFGTDFTAL